MKPVCARCLSVWRGLKGGLGNAGMRPERRIKPGVDGGLRAASCTARRTVSKKRRNLAQTMGSTSVDASVRKEYRTTWLKEKVVLPIDARMQQI
jgi:hypothetical protein